MGDVRMQDDASTRSRPADQRAAEIMEVLLTVAPDAELDREAGERVTRRLRAEIGELDVESVRPGPGAPAPDAAKGTDAVTLGARRWPAAAPRPSKTRSPTRLPRCPSNCVAR
ncbi:hypothetical protein GCM10011579_067820 [Streptomyces albiflavescens]|uniref:Uncharacterized protein n=1 Tax=Streptomyces albiflavescens TaxID=1623582 RepID=A0A917YBU1_9ACTN|nr:hypothetical protein GCM10011579_067820 [Streptomyces albiflavescens]